MIKSLTFRTSILGACLLQACAAPPAPRELLVQPALHVRHSANETANAYYQMGKYHQDKGDLSLALTAFTYAIARDARHLEARNAAAALHAQQGRLDQARAMMLAVVADYPRASQSHNNLGYIDYLRGDFAGATAAIRQALLIDPRNERARNNLRLAETALAARSVPAAPAQAIMAPQIAAAPVVAAPVIAAPVVAVAAAPAPREPALIATRGAAMELVQLQPNVYELKRPAMQALPTVLAAPAPLVAAAPAKALAPSRLVVANGNGARGLAKRFSSALGKQGIKVAALSNERPYGQQTTRIQYRNGYKAQAEALRSTLRGQFVLVPSMTLAADTDLRLILGKDAVQTLAMQEAVSGVTPLAAR
jgi:Flp pilus assembly protein TadD